MIILDIRQLTYFVEISEQKSYTKASQRLNVSQPALSKSVQRLEDELGVNLFLRTPGKIELTNDGVEVLNNAKELVDYFNLMQKKMQNIKNKSVSTFSLGLSYITSSFFSIKHIVELFDKNNIALFPCCEDTSEELIKKVSLNKLNAAICLFCGKESPLPSNVNIYPLCSGNIMLAYKNEFSKNGAAIPTELSCLADEIGSSTLFFDHMSDIYSAISISGFYALLPDIALSSLPEGIICKPIPKQYEIVLVTGVSEQHKKFSKDLKAYANDIFKAPPVLNKAL